MTVIIVSDFANINGGAAKVAIETARGLAQAGQNVIFFAGCGKPSEMLSHENIRVIALGMPELARGNKLKMFFQGIKNRRSEIEFGKLLDTVDPDETIVHIHSWVKVLSPTIFRALKRRHMPFIITAHDYFLTCPNGGFFHYKHNEICTLKRGFRCFCTNCDSRSYPIKLWRILRDRFQRKCLKNCDFSLIVISDLMKRVLGNEAKRVYLLKNPIDFNESRTISDNYEDAFAFVGRLSREKGIETYCEALRMTGYRGYIVGDGPIASDLRTRYCGKNLVFTGWKNRDEVKAVYSSVRCLVFPSVWYEGAPLTIPEAQSYGVPCLVSDACSAAEDIVDGVNGYVFPSKDAEALSEHMKRIMQFDRNEIDKLRKSTFDRCMADNLTLQTHIEKLIGIYDKEKQSNYEEQSEHESR